ncbi:MAG: branched-chain amino acid ABC transporter ATP-binding protein/permease [Thermodesulfobacteriota bacterium]
MRLRAILGRRLGDVPVAPTLAALAGLALLPWVMPNNYWVRIAGNAGLWVMLALGLNVVAGFAGLLDLGYIAFFAVGGYTYGLIASDHFGLHLPFWAAAPLCALTSSAFGWLLGLTSLRLKGDYLAIVTLAFAQILRLLLLNLDRPINITGGPNGLVDLDFANLFGYTFRTVTQYYYLILFLGLLVLLGSFRLKRSRLGRGWEAIREDELAAEATGVNVTFMKLLAFGLGAGVAGGVGAVFASWQGGVFPNNFDFPQLVTVYAMLILGGTGNIWGVVLAAVILTVLPEALREYGGYRMIFYGLLLVVMMAFRPQGLLGDFRWGRRPAKLIGDEAGAELKSAKELFYDREKGPAPLLKQRPVLDRGRELLRLEKVSMHFGGLQAVDRLDLSVGEGEIVALIGPNGAGKTTVFNIVSGIYAPTQGRVLFAGRDITGLRPHVIVGHGLARTFQSLRLFGNMTVLENALVAQHCRTGCGLPAILLRRKRFVREEERARRVAEENLGLFGRRLGGFRQDMKPVNLSYANRRRLEIARAMSTQCRLLLLDEPSAGMNPQETVEITEFIRELRDRFGFTLLLIEHKLNLVKTISDRVVVLNFGAKIAEGEYAAVVDDAQVIEAYLGRKRTDGR